MASPDFLPKPIELDRLFALLKTYLGVEWSYQAPPPNRPTPTGSLIAPPPPELARLQNLADIGDISGLRAELDKIEVMDNLYQPFVAEIRHLAKQFQITAVQSLIREYTGVTDETTH